MQFVFFELGIWFLNIIQLNFRLQEVNEKSSQEYVRDNGGVTARGLNFGV
jgi:hypothetical protein